MRLDFSKEKLPYHDIATLVTQPAFPVSYAVVCDAPIDEASTCIPLLDAAVVMSTSFSEDRKTFYFTWRTPHHGAIWVLVFSRREIHICDIHPSTNSTLGK